MARRSNQKRPRDPHAPKKAKTAWQLFDAENREEVQVIYKNFFSKKFFRLVFLERKS
jgi:hypothetical protein